MVVVMTTCYRDKLHMLTEVHGENKTGVFHFLVETIVRRYRVNIIRALPEISLQCQPEIRLLQQRLKAPQICGLVQTACTQWYIPKDCNFLII